MKNSPSQATVGTYDGLRVSVQKQLNLNSVVSHFYWLGSQATGQPIYQYRIIFADDDKFINISTDADINVEGEVKWPLVKRTQGKLNFTLADQAKSGVAEVHYNGDNWTGHVSLGRSPGWVAGCSYVQAITPFLNLGGYARWDISKDAFSQGFVGAYDKEENLIAAKYDTNLQILYLRRVNPNRVNVSTDLVLGEDLSTTMTLSAEYILKQSKLNFSVDSNLFLKSMLETTIAPGTSIQFSAEVLHAKEHYRFGYGITMGGN
eukprot:CAMPEP_0174825016 /NCGR_PEP_ID=MMETSP1107-20130205/41055_1 /TAXON_ID=36770 /ORGANISM="Paraphysomonas vestita, Strain GFlagA" /LENGTH=261 /DNA_ID=CAMNT_0016055699 /DNA_START=201 /DNA_END=986 /DNA_ORIENTATION=+